MAPGWMHETIDLIAWGRIYWSVHEAKDKPWITLGRAHRQEKHELYQEARQCSVSGASVSDVLAWMTEQAKKMTETRWKQGLPPDKIEAEQAYLAHDMLDYSWDFVPREERLGWVAAFKDVVIYPEKYPNLFMPEITRQCVNLVSIRNYTPTLKDGALKSCCNFYRRSYRKYVHPHPVP
ncbi:MAG: hypothetical protein HY676_00925 [Chloroflexi bacterium]|nr:hypothetical protein [Chloroflexota bacterium]